MKSRYGLATAAIAVVAVTFAWSAVADVVAFDPTQGTFGQITPLNPADSVTFGGSGIPTNAVNYATFTNGSGLSLLVGLSATPHYFAPTPTNDGNGTFFVQPGVDPTHGNLPFWNFSYFAELSDGTDISTIGLKLYYDLDPGLNTAVSDLGVIDFGAYGPLGHLAQDSQNIGFSFLSTGATGITHPAVTSFDPNHGQYSFRLGAAGFGYVDMNVNTVPLPAGLPLLGSAFAGLALLRRRTKAKA